MGFILSLALFKRQAAFITEFTLLNQLYPEITCQAVFLKIE